MEHDAPCVFCARVASGDFQWENEHAVGFRDRFPVSLGHALVVPRRHESDFFALPREEQLAVWDLAAGVRGALAEELGLTSFNAGVNAGEAAGQTVSHAHVHVIPRRPGDVPDPRGGVRWVVPDRAAYWQLEVHEVTVG